METTVFTQIGH